MAGNEEVSKDVLLRRLKRIEGQVRGVQKMIGENRECESLVMQLVAIRAAIEGVGSLVLNNYMKLCFRKSGGADEVALNSLARAVSIWGRVRIGDSR